MEIRRIAVLGTGTMGSQIAMACALAGYDTVAYDPDPAALTRAELQLRSRLERDVAKGRRTAEEFVSGFGWLRFTDKLPEAVSDADVVIEAAVERLDVKHDLFARVEELAPAHAILASNTSGFVPSRIAEPLKARERLVVMHFFNPALVMRCVEIVSGPETSPRARDAVAGLARSLGKEPIVLDREIPGFVANRILNAVRDEAIFLVENGYATVTAVDAACRTALGYPMGPFELMDLTGLDIGHHTKLARMADSGDPADGPSTTVSRLVAAGHLGRKTGRGWYAYAPDGTKIGENPWT